MLKRKMKKKIIKKYHKLPKANQDKKKRQVPMIMTKKE